MQGLLDTRGVAAHLGVSERTVRNLISRGELGYLRVGRLVRFTPAHVEAYTNRATVIA